MIVHLIGKGPGFLDAPALSEDYKVWGLSDVILYRQVDILFNMHDVNKLLPPQKLAAIISEQNGIPFISIKEYEWLSNSEPFPLAEIMEEHGHKYFGSSICYMIAYAIYKGITDLHLWGVCFFSNHRDVEQRCAVEYWLGVATGKGLNITIHGESALLKVGKENKIYGYEDVTYKNDFNPYSHNTITLGQYDKMKENEK